MDEPLWERTLEAVREQVSNRVYDAWIKPLRPAGPVRDGVLELLAPNALGADVAQSRYGQLLESALSGEAGQRLRIVLRIDPQGRSVDEADPTGPIGQTDQTGQAGEGQTGEGQTDAVGGLETTGADGAARPQRRKSDGGSDSAAAPLDPVADAADAQAIGLNARYSFESFVVGGCNQFVHAAAERVAEQPAGAYNPLFIHGAPGLGKTHIMQAIGNRIRQTRPDVKILYIRAEVFMTRLINALRSSGMIAFKERFRSVDVLLMDDIYFIAGKKATQEEFFHTFNALYEANKQIVLTSDRFPSEIEHLEERLRSRFAMGLVADMQPPDLETRVAILKQKAAMEGMTLRDEVAFFLAEAIQTNVRELEGALIRVSARSSLDGQPVTLGLVKETMRDLIKVQDKRVTIDSIQKSVAQYYGVRLSEMLSNKRSRRLSHPRQVAMHLCKQLTRCSYPEIGQSFGGRDHTTVLYAVGAIEKKKAADAELARQIDELAAMLR